MHRDEYESITHDEAEPVLPTEQLPANSVKENRPAEILIQKTPNEKILTVTPTSLASSMYLHQHTLTAIKIHELPEQTIKQLGETTDRPIKKHELITIGKTNKSKPNHSIEEYS